MSASLAASEPSTKAAAHTTGPSPAVMGTYARQNLVFERGEGAWLITADGDRYLDFASGIAVNVLGHAHPRLVAALTEQAGKLWHTSNLYRVEGQERLAERLVAETFADKVFFCNSGAEACEAAIKAARRYHFVSGKPERWRIVTFNGAFHGRTLATIAAGGNAKYLEGFGPPVEGFDHVPFGDLAAVEQAIGPETAAIMIEPAQGEGGINVARHGVPAGAARAVRQARPAAHIRRGPVRHGPLRQAVRLRVGGHHARPHGHRQGYRRRLSARARCWRRKRLRRA